MARSPWVEPGGQIAIGPGLLTTLTNTYQVKFQPGALRQCQTAIVNGFASELFQAFFDSEARDLAFYIGLPRNADQDLAGLSDEKLLDDVGAER